MDGSNTTTAVPSPTQMNTSDAQPAVTADDADRNGNSTGKLASVLPGKVPRVTLRTIFMAILVAMGGFIFGYDTGKVTSNKAHLKLF